MIILVLGSKQRLEYKDNAITILPAICESRPLVFSG